MTDAGTIASAIGALKAAGDIAKSLIGLRDAALVESKIIDLRRELLAALDGALSAKADQLALLERIGHLEAGAMKHQTWLSEKDRFKLTDFGSGTLAYVLKEG